MSYNIVSICVQNFTEHELIKTELCSFMYILNLRTQLVTSPTFADLAVYILYIFANNFGIKRDSLLQ